MTTDGLQRTGLEGVIADRKRRLRCAMVTIKYLGNKSDERSWVSF
jgi:hypothetical protein